MTTILHIDSSILGGYSVSRDLSANIVARQQALREFNSEVRHPPTQLGGIPRTPCRAA